MTTKQVRLDEQVLEALGKVARPFESPNQTLRRVLGIDKDEEGDDRD